jgi:hypothetical protein
MNTTFVVSHFDRHQLPALRVTPSDLVEIAAPLLGWTDTKHPWYFETGNQQRFVRVESVCLTRFCLLGDTRPSAILDSCTFKMPPEFVGERRHHRSDPAPQTNGHFRKSGSSCPKLRPSPETEEKRPLEPKCGQLRLKASGTIAAVSCISLCGLQCV